MNIPTNRKDEHQVPGAGLPGGLHFALAVTAVTKAGAPSAKSAGVLYALDLAGAAAGGLLASLLLLPIFGMMTTLGVLNLTFRTPLPVYKAIFSRWFFYRLTGQSVPFSRDI